MWDGWEVYLCAIIPSLYLLHGVIDERESTSIVPISEGGANSGSMHYLAGSQN
jgi:hypothetical protein